MPYTLVKSVAGGKKGYRVRSQDGTYLSKNALPRERAVKQLRAVYLAEARPRK
jgi:hypothetical protein